MVDDERDDTAPEVVEGEETKVEESPRRQRLDADFLLDKVIPDEIDWRDLVRRHPFIAVGVAAGLGFALGRGRGAAIVAGASTAISAAVMRQLSDVFEGEVFEF
jgi:hypothetical protein